MSTFHTTGIVLRVSHSGENDRRASIYTHDHGKLEVFAKSARRIQSKLSPHLEPITLVDCYIARGRVDHLAGIERHERFPGVRKTIEQLADALWATELVDVLTRLDHPDPRIFRLLEMWMLLVENSGPSVAPATFRLAFVATLFRYLGHGIQCDACVRCRRTASISWSFIARDGGVRCVVCMTSQKSAIADFCEVALDDASRGALATLVANDPPRFEIEDTNALPERTARTILDHLLAEHLDQTLRTDFFITRLSSLA